MNTVSAVRCDSYGTDIVYDAIKESLRNLNFKLDKKSVLIKPNAVAPLAPDVAATTNPSILDTICRILSDNNCEITIGESSGDDKTIRSFKVSGIKAVAEKYDIPLISFELSKPIKSNINGKILKTAYIAEPVLNADLVINVPKLKTHAFMGLSGAVKNLLGVMPGAQKQEMHVKAVSTKEFTQLLIDLYNFLRPGLNIVDAVIGMEGGGPVKGKPIKIGYILAGRDALAVDVIAAQLVGLEHTYYYKKISSLLSESPVLKGSLDKVKCRTSTNIFDDALFLPRSIKKTSRKLAIGKPDVTKSKCDGCGLCKKTCGFDAIYLKQYPVFDMDKCIKCYGCYEICPTDAIFIKKNLAIRSLLRLRESILSNR